MAEKSRFSMVTVCVTVAVICIAVLACGGQWLPDVVDKMQIVQLKSLSVKLVPTAVNLLLGALVFCVAYLLYRPAKSALNRTLEKAGSHERGKIMVLRTLQLLYWLITVFVILSLVAPDLLGKLFLGISVFTAAMALALKDIADDVVSGTLLLLTRRFNIDDDIALVGIDVKGKIVDIGYLSTRIKSSDGIQIVPNRTMWGTAGKILKPVSMIILPPGYEPPQPDAEEATDKGAPKIFRLFQS